MCKCTGNVIYGKGSTWTEAMEADNEIACTNGVFGDPIHGTVKECICLPSGNDLTLIIYTLARLLDITNVTSQVFNISWSFLVDFVGHPNA